MLSLIPSEKKYMYKYMNGIENVRGMKNQRPVMFAFDFSEAKNIIVKRDIKKDLLK